MDSMKAGSLGVSGMKLAPITEDNAPSEMGEAAGDFPWAELDKYAAMLHERDAMQKKEQICRLQSELKKDLDQQVSDNRVRKQKERDSDLQYFNNQVGEIEKWKEHEQSRIMSQKEKHQKEKEDRDEQLRYSNSLKEAETAKRQDEDQQLLNKIAQELDTERRLYETRKKQQREGMGKSWNSTQDASNEKKKKIAAQQEEDTQQMNQYIKMLEDKEKKKQDDTKRRLDAHADFLDNIKASGLESEKERALSETARVTTEHKEATKK